MDVEIIQENQENGILRINALSLEQCIKIEGYLKIKGYLPNLQLNQAKKKNNNQSFRKQIKKRWSSFFMNSFIKYITQIKQNLELAQLIKDRKQSKKSKQKKLEQGDIQYMLKYHNQQFIHDWIEFLNSDYFKNIIENNKKINIQSKKLYIKLIPVIIKESSDSKPFYKFIKDDQISENIQIFESVEISYNDQDTL